MSRRYLDDSGLRHGKPSTLRWIYTHMIEEYARHKGHADLFNSQAGSPGFDFVLLSFTPARARPPTSPASSGP